MKPIVYHPAARAEYLRALAFYEKQRRGLGLELQTEIDDALRRIRHSPSQYPLYEDDDVRRCIVRRFPYAIIYAELHDRIWIAAIAHHKRKPAYWAKRKPD